MMKHNTTVTWVEMYAESITFTVHNGLRFNIISRPIADLSPACISKKREGVSIQQQCVEWYERHSRGILPVFNIRH